MAVHRVKDQLFKFRGLFILFFVSVAVAVALLMAEGNGFLVRRLAFEAAELLYSVYDPLSEYGTIRFGPPAPDAPPLEVMIQRLKQALPEYVISVELPRRLSPERPIRFHHEDLASDRLREFERAAAPLLEGDADPFVLSQRVRALTTHKRVLAPPPETDPLEYLRRAQHGSSLTCRYFSVIHGTACALKGYTSRVLGLSLDGTRYDHAVTEVYIPELGKWIVIDCDFNVAWRRNGVWLDARELHDAWLAVKAPDGHGDALAKTTLKGGETAAARAGIEVVVLGAAGERLREHSTRNSSRGELGFFEYVFYSLRNDYLTATYSPGQPYRSGAYVLSPDPLQGPPPVCPEAHIPRSMDEVYWPVGRTAFSGLELASTRPLAVSVLPVCWTPNFSHFEYRLGGGQWHESAGNTLEWPLLEGHNLLEVRSVNLAGLRGETASARIELRRKQPRPAL